MPTTEQYHRWIESNARDSEAIRLHLAERSTSAIYHWGRFMVDGPDPTSGLFPEFERARAELGRNVESVENSGPYSWLETDSFESETMLENRHQQYVGGILSELGLGISLISSVVRTPSDPAAFASPPRLALQEGPERFIPGEPLLQGEAPAENAGDTDPQPLVPATPEADEMPHMTLTGVSPTFLDVQSPNVMFGSSQQRARRRQNSAVGFLGNVDGPIRLVRPTPQPRSRSVDREAERLDSEKELERVRASSYH
ncbi:MAG: hypothetical protein TREMPRED_005091 [Tremellales sp. Tagirdzhanova-0007]|nr:MAG: hypothetical protein TREMPRED_005091 [Tremellales sp. Tagirdzhanova-0007]